MADHAAENRIDGPAARLLKAIPPLAGVTRNRGVPFAVSWAHRLSGLLLVAFIGFHVFTLSALTAPAEYADKMKLYQLPLLSFLEWAFAVPVMFHALNGARLILYESFRFRTDEVLLNWVAGLSLLFAGILAVLMWMGNQNVSAVFFWLIAAAAGAIAVYGLYARLGPTAHAWSWKLQRITAAFLLVMIPAHFLFMHLGPQIATDPGAVALRMQNPWIKLVDGTLVVSALYHGGYGLISILNDYTGSRGLRRAGAAVVIAAGLAVAAMGLKLIVSV